MKNKRGFELSWQFLFNLIFILAILVTIVIWINSQASGGALKKQLLAKETCLLITKARANTILMIEHVKSIDIEAQDNAIVVRDGSFDRGYSYPCYLKKDIEISKKDNITIIEIK